MRPGRYLLLASILGATSALGGCGRDFGPVEPQTLSAVAQPAAGAGAVPADGEARTPRRSGGGAPGLELGEESLTLGLLAPSLPGLALGTYSSACDPFEDSLGSCL